MIDILVAFMEQSPNPWFRFEPPRRLGYTLNGAALLVDLVILLVLLAFAIDQPPGFLVILVLSFALLFSLPLPLLMYRLYSLWQSAYWVGRDGVRLRWGLRQIDLPYDKIMDTARADELEQTLTLPRWNWPGSIVGEVDDPELGMVEFLASDKDRLVVIGTKKRVYAISAENPQDFVASLKRESERGSLRPLKAYSTQPIFILTEAWAQPLNRRLLILGGLAALALLFFVGLVAPRFETVSLGFDVSGQPLPAVAGVQLLLLPALNLFFYMGNFILGLLFYRESSGTWISHLLWGASLATSLFYLGAVLFSLGLST